MYVRMYVYMYVCKSMLASESDMYKEFMNMYVAAQLTRWAIQSTIVQKSLSHNFWSSSQLSLHCSYYLLGEFNIS